MQAEFGCILGFFEEGVFLDEIVMMWVIFLISQHGLWVLAEGLTQTNHLNEYQIIIINQLQACRNRINIKSNKIPTIKLILKTQFKQASLYQFQIRFMFGKRNVSLAELAKDIKSEGFKHFLENSLTPIFDTCSYLHPYSEGPSHLAFEQILLLAILQKIQMAIQTEEGLAKKFQDILQKNRKRVQVVSQLSAQSIKNSQLFMIQSMNNIKQRRLKNKDEYFKYAGFLIQCICDKKQDKILIFKTQAQYTVADFQKLEQQFGFPIAYIDYDKKVFPDLKNVYFNHICILKAKDKYYRLYTNRKDLNEIKIMMGKSRIQNSELQKIFNKPSESVKSTSRIDEEDEIVPSIKQPKKQANPPSTIEQDKTKTQASETKNQPNERKMQDQIKKQQVGQQRTDKKVQSNIQEKDEGNIFDRVKNFFTNEEPAKQQTPIQSPTVLPPKQKQNQSKIGKSNQTPLQKQPKIPQKTQIPEKKQSEIKKASSTFLEQEDEIVFFANQIPCSVCHKKEKEYDCINWNYQYFCGNCIISPHVNTSDIPAQNIAKYCKDRNINFRNYEVVCPQCTGTTKIRNYDPRNKPKYYQCGMCDKNICLQHNGNIYDCFCICPKCRLTTLFINKLNINFCLKCRKRHCFDCNKQDYKFCKCVCQNCLNKDSEKHECVKQCHQCHNINHKLKQCRCGLLICFGCYYFQLQRPNFECNFGDYC